MFYYAPATNSPKSIIQMALQLAKDKGADVFNALDIMGNMEAFEELKFGSGDGYLHYYLYNYRMPNADPKEIGMILV